MGRVLWSANFAFQFFDACFKFIKFCKKNFAAKTLLLIFNMCRGLGEPEGQGLESRVEGGGDLVALFYKRMLKGIKLKVFESLLRGYKCKKA